MRRLGFMVLVSAWRRCGLVPFDGALHADRAAGDRGCVEALAAGFAPVLAVLTPADSPCGTEPGA